jgi:RecB family exonuclease
VLRFYGHGEQTPEPKPSLLPHGERSGFVVPAPRRGATKASSINTLRVTAFRDYLVCPYRFYLRHVLRLESVDDRAVELDGAAFGRLAHEVMQRFGKSELADAIDPEPIAGYLSHALDKVAKEQFGADPPAAVVIQIEQLRQRLWALARWQAEQAIAGWRVVKQHIERDLIATLDVDGEPFTVKGRIDRIDQHEQHGYRILDYKTADSAQSPEGAHRDADGTWTDFQLPLYAVLARKQYNLAGPIALGYVQMPKDLRKVGFAQVEWSDDEIVEAIERVKEIVRKVRRGEFWPPNAPPPFVDEFGRICMDECLDRKDAIARATIESAGANPSPHAGEVRGRGSSTPGEGGARFGLDASEASATSGLNGFHPSPRPSPLRGEGVRP